MKTAILVILLSLLYACSSTTPAKRTHYRLSENTLDFSIDRQSTSDVLVYPTSAQGVLGSRPMVAEKTEGGLVQLDYNFWLESPRVLVHQQLIRWAENRFSGLVFSKPNNKKSYLRIDSEIRAFEKKGNTAIVEITFTVKESRGGIILRKTYRQDETIQTAGFSQFAESISSSLSSIIHQFDEDLTQCCLQTDS